MIKYKKGKENIIADALLHRHNLASTLSTKVIWFELIRDLYKNDTNSGAMYVLT